MSEPHASKGEIRNLENALLGLSQRDREILADYNSGKPVRQIAQQQRDSVSNIWLVLGRAIKSLEASGGTTSS